MTKYAGSSLSVIIPVRSDKMLAYQTSKEFNSYLKTGREDYQRNVPSTKAIYDSHAISRLSLAPRLGK
jgi:hypothetical protein